jgi:hypothetical protein
MMRPVGHLLNLLRRALQAKRAGDHWVVDQVLACQMISSDRSPERWNEVNRWS